jgi:hypothetical protein
MVSKYIENATGFVVMIFNSMLVEIDEDNRPRSLCFSKHYCGEEIKDVDMTKYQQFFLL